MNDHSTYGGANKEIEPFNNDYTSEYTPPPSKTYTREDLETALLLAFNFHTDLTEEKAVKEAQLIIDSISNE